MNRFFKYLAIGLFGTLSLTSCDEDIILNDSPGATNAAGKGLAAFVTSGSQFDMRLSEASNIFVYDAEIEVSSTANVDRVINFTINQDGTDPGQYTVLSAIVPANSHFGKISFQFDRDTFSLCDYKFISLELVSIDSQNVDAQNNTHNIKVGIPVELNTLNGDWESTTWFYDEIYSVHNIVIDEVNNTITIEDFWEPAATNRDFVLNFNPSTNAITFDTQYTGFNYTDASMGWSNVPVNATLGSGVSKFDPCTGEISIYVNYPIGTTGYTFGNKNERFFKI